MVAAGQAGRKDVSSPQTPFVTFAKPQATSTPFTWILIRLSDQVILADPSWGRRQVLNATRADQATSCRVLWSSCPWYICGLHVSSHHFRSLSGSHLFEPEPQVSTPRYGRAYHPSVYGFAVPRSMSEQLVLCMTGAIRNTSNSDADENQPRLHDIHHLCQPRIACHC